MQNIFEQIYFQNKCNGEKVPLSQEYKRLAQILIEKEKILLEKLEDNAELKKLFSEFGDAEMQTHARSVFDRDGFFTDFGWKCSTAATRKLQNIVLIQGMLVAKSFHFGADGFERRLALVDDLRDQAGDRARILFGKPAGSDRRRAQTDTAGHERAGFLKGDRIFIDGDIHLVEHFFKLRTITLRSGHLLAVYLINTILR